MRAHESFVKLRGCHRSESSVHFSLPSFSWVIFSAQMGGLQAANFCSASPSCHRSSMYTPSPRLLRLSVHPSEFMHTEVCKHHMFVDNTQAQISKGLPAGRLTLRATTTSTPANDDQGLSMQSIPAAIKNIFLDVLRWMDAFYCFSRPHTLIGTVISMTSISLVAVQSFQDFCSLRFVVGLGQVLFPFLCMHLYTVGLNQIFDIEIDKVNKPYLPLASGEFSLTTGISIVTFSAFLSFAIGVYIGSRPVLWALSTSFILSTGYSVELPWMRWKQSPFASACTIISYRAIVVQLACSIHMQCFVFERDFVMSKPLIFAIGFMCCFVAVISLFKDIPDLDGDRAFGIRSLTVQLGQKRVFWLCISILLVAYGLAALVGVTCEMIWARMAMVLGHAILASILSYRASQIDLKSKAAFANFYMFVWKLFYTEYFMIPFMR